MPIKSLGFSTYNEIGFVISKSSISSYKFIKKIVNTQDTPKTNIAMPIKGLYKQKGEVLKKINQPNKKSEEKVAEVKTLNDLVIKKSNPLNDLNSALHKTNKYSEEKVAFNIMPEKFSELKIHNDLVIKEPKPLNNLNSAFLKTNKPSEGKVAFNIRTEKLAEVRIYNNLVIKESKPLNNINLDVPKTNKHSEEKIAFNIMPEKLAEVKINNDLVIKEPKLLNHTNSDIPKTNINKKEQDVVHTANGKFGEVKIYDNYVIKEFKSLSSLEFTEEEKKKMNIFDIANEEVANFNAYYSDGSAKLIVNDNKISIKMKKIEGTTLESLSDDDCEKAIYENVFAFYNMLKKLFNLDIVHADFLMKNIIYHEHNFYPIDISNSTPETLISSLKIIKGILKYVTDKDKSETITLTWDELKEDLTNNPIKIKLEYFNTKNPSLNQDTSIDFTLVNDIHL